MDKNQEHYDKVQKSGLEAVSFEGATPQEEELDAENKVRAAKEFPQLEWYNRQLYQVLALNTRGEALAQIKLLAEAEHEARRGISAWWRLTRDHRGTSDQIIMGLASRVFHPTWATTLAASVAHVELWESRVRAYEKLVLQTEGIATKMPDSCKVLVLRNMVPEDL